MARYYELHLPVFKQGDDLDYQLEQAKGNNAEALSALSECYQAAADACQRLSAMCAKRPELQFEGCTHHIGVRGPSDLLAALAEEGLLSAEEYEEEEEDELGEDEDGDGEEDEEKEAVNGDTKKEKTVG